jgi:DNA-binding SARP family transcriptional activator
MATIEAPSDRCNAARAWVAGVEALSFLASSRRRQALEMRYDRANLRDLPTRGAMVAMTRPILDAAMARLHLALLGGFEARLGVGPPLRLPTRKAKALLAFLALPAGRVRAREQLADLLWGRTGHQQARNNLRQTLFLLRRCLGDFAGLNADGDAVWLVPELVTVDAVALETAAGDGSADRVDDVRALYAGDLLEGFGLREPAFHEWLLVERERLRSLALKMYGRALERAVSAGASERAIEIARALLALDPFQERAHRALMRLHVEQGQRGLALRQYQACRELLGRELGVTPDAETEALHRALTAPEDLGASALAATPGFAAKPAVVRPGVPAVAVLPFRLDDSETERADRLTADVIAALSGWGDFGVLSRGTVFVYKRRLISPLAMAAELGVSYVVEGSLRRDGTRLRAEFLVVDATTGRLLARERIDQVPDDTFPSIDDLIRRIAAFVGTAVGCAEGRRSPMLPPGDRDAWTLYRLGMTRFDEHSPEGHAEARHYFEEALALDPGFARAWARIGFSHVLDADFHYAPSREGALRVGLEALQRASAINEGDWFTHVGLGRALLRLGHFDLALEETERAVELNPSSPAVHSHLGNLLAFMGEPERGIAGLEYSVYLNARSVPPECPMHSALARAYLNARRYETAVAKAQRAILSGNDLAWSYAILAASLGHLDRPEEAAAALRKCEELHPGRVAKEFALPPTNYRDPADHFHILAGLRKAGFSG